MRSWIPTAGLVCAGLALAAAAGAAATAAPEGGADAPTALVEGPTDPEEQFELGRRLLFGLDEQGEPGAEPRPAEGIRWLRRAAEQGHAKAQLHLGMAYQQGRGVEIDHQEAVNWLRMAADQDHPKAQLELGVAYRDGRGVLIDEVRALMWLILASYHRSAAYQVVMAGLARRLDAEQRQEAQDLARTWRSERNLEYRPPPDLDAAGQVLPLAKPTGRRRGKAAAPPEPSPPSSTPDG